MNNLFDKIKIFKSVYIIMMINIMFIFLIIIPQESTADTPGNNVTCYSTLGHWNSGDIQYTVYDCGPCTKVNCSSYTDSGHCVYHAANDNGTVPTI